MLKINGEENKKRPDIPEEINPALTNWDNVLENKHKKKNKEREIKSLFGKDRYKALTIIEKITFWSVVVNTGLLIANIIYVGITASSLKIAKESNEASGKRDSFYVNVARTENQPLLQIDIENVHFNNTTCQVGVKWRISNIGKMAAHLEFYEVCFVIETNYDRSKSDSLRYNTAYHSANRTIEKYSAYIMDHGNDISTTSPMMSKTFYDTVIHGKVTSLFFGKIFYKSILDNSKRTYEFMIEIPPTKNLNLFHLLYNNNQEFEYSIDDIYSQ